MKLSKVNERIAPAAILPDIIQHEEGNGFGLRFKFPDGFAPRQIETFNAELPLIVGNCYHKQTNKVFICDAGSVDYVILEIDGNTHVLTEKEIGDNGAFFIPKSVAYAFELQGGCGLICLSDTDLTDDSYSNEIMELG